MGTPTVIGPTQFKFDTSFSFPHPPLSNNPPQSYNQPAPTIQQQPQQQPQQSTTTTPTEPGEGDSHTNISVLDGVKVTTLSNHEILLSDLWKEKRVVLVVFRRFGCMMCREAAVRMSALRSKLEELGARVVGIGFDSPSEVQEFLLYWNGELYLDQQRNVYKALGVRRFKKQKLLRKHSLIRE